MVKTYEWSPSSQGKALGLCAAGNHPLREITKIINIPKSTIEDIKTRGTAITKPRPGCPKKVSICDIRQIIRYIRTNKSTCRISLTQLKRIFHFNVHEHTIRNALQKVGYHHRVARCRPYLNKCDRKRRLKFARKYKDWTVEQWASVLFSDEMAVKLFTERRSKDYVWRTVEEEFHPDCIDYVRHHKGTGLMFWAVFRKGKIGPGLLEKGESVNSTVYWDQILLGPVQQFWEE